MPLVANGIAGTLNAPLMVCGYQTPVNNALGFVNQCLCLAISLGVVPFLDYTDRSSGVDSSDVGLMLG